MSLESRAEMDGIVMRVTLQPLYSCPGSLYDPVLLSCHMIVSVSCSAIWVVSAQCLPNMATPMPRGSPWGITSTDNSPAHDVVAKPRIQLATLSGRCPGCHGFE